MARVSQDVPASRTTCAPAPPRPPLSAREHEALCQRCGKCCYRKVIVGRTVVITPFPCEYLQTATRTCAIYERRAELNPSCLSVAEGLRRSAFPASCPYVAACAPPDYQPAVEDWSWQGQWADFDALADDLGVTPAVREEVRARGPDAPPPWAALRGKSPEAAAQASCLPRRLPQTESERLQAGSLRYPEAPCP